MDKSDIKHPAKQLAAADRAGVDAAWMSQHTVFFFDLELLLPHQPIASGFERAKVLVGSHLRRIVRRKDRVLWTVSGFYLVIDCPKYDQALIVAERVKEQILAQFLQPQSTASPQSAMAMRLVSETDLGRFSLASV